MSERPLESHEGGLILTARGSEGTGGGKQIVRESYREAGDGGAGP